MSGSDVFVRIDVATADFVVHCRPSSAMKTAANDGRGFAETEPRLMAIEPALVVLEAKCVRKLLTMLKAIVRSNTAWWVHPSLSA
jgi:hypothetical protein